MSMLDQMLAEEERVPCVFKCNVPDLGFLDTSHTFHNHYHHLQGKQSNNNNNQNQSSSSNSSNDLLEGAKVDLPLWLAQDFSKYQFVNMEIPKHYDKKMRDTINASALNLNLKEYSPYYFEVGMVIANTKRDDELKDTLRIAFSGDRYSNLMVNALSSSSGDSAEFANKLTSKEAELYFGGVNSAREIEAWRRQRLHNLRSSSILGRRQFSELGGGNDSNNYPGKRR